MNMMLHLRVHTGLTIKDQVRQPKHVKRRQQGSDRSHEIQPILPVHKGMGHDLVFAPKPRQWRNTGDSQGSDEKHPMSPRNFRPKPTHFSDVLFSPYRMDYGSGREKQ